MTQLSCRSVEQRTAEIFREPRWLHHKDKPPTDLWWDRVIDIFRKGDAVIQQVMRFEVQEQPCDQSFHRWLVERYVEVCQDCGQQRTRDTPNK